MPYGVRGRWRTLLIMPTRSRTYDFDLTRAAVTAQFQHVREAAERLDAERLASSTRLGDWTVRELLAHICLGMRALNRGLGPALEGPRHTLADWAAGAADRAAAIDEGTRALAASAAPTELLERAGAQFTEMISGAPADSVIAHPAGAIRLDDYLLTRCVELVVHTDDLNDATGADVPLDRQTLATATRLLADAFAAKAPGNSVELRIPPYAAVQCVEGPRHTRGTPPNVVETDPLTWLRLATGRTDWQIALDAAELFASGERADLSPYLPVLR
jgi:uncharacterized protein (TIGR03083 family)